MPRLPAGDPRDARSRLRGLIGLVVLSGYLLVLGGSSVGQGWQTLAHLTRSHAAAPLEAPEVYAEAPDGVARTMPTLRTLPGRLHGHTHGTHLHRHEAPPPRPGSGAPVRAHAPPAADGFHEHGGTVHTHDAPLSEPPSAVTAVALDKHRLPAATVLPPPPPPRSLAFAQAESAPRLVETRVETPPPRARG